MQKNSYNHTREYTKKAHLQKRVSKIKASKNILKEKQRKEQLNKARKKASEKIREALTRVITKIKNVIVEIFTKKTIFTGIIIIILVLTLVCAIIGVTTLFGYSANLVLDEESDFIYEYVSELDKSINKKIENAEKDYSGYDEYRRNTTDMARTNQELIYAYLKAKYGDEKISYSASNNGSNN